MSAPTPPPTPSPAPETTGTVIEVDEPTAVEDAQAEAEAATVYPDGCVPVELVTDDGTAILHVLPAGKWKSRANSALRTGEFETWASLCLAEDDYEIWRELDPTNDNVNAFFKSWRETSGQDSGKSRASQRS